MRLKRRLKKYGAIVSTAFRQALSERAMLLARMLLYVVLLTVFSRLWRAVSSAGELDARESAHFVWYLAITEWVLLSAPAVHNGIEADVRSGDLAYLLPRPVSYVGARIAQGSGELLARMLVLGPTGVLAALALTGRLHERPGELLLTIPFGIVAGVLLVLFLTAIGLSAFWLYDTNPLYWVFSKAMFVLGGLMLPLDIYPSWLKAVAQFTPFSAMLYGPGRIALGYDNEHLVAVASSLAAWLFVTAFGVSWLSRRALRSVEIGGG